MVSSQTADVGTPSSPSNPPSRARRVPKVGVLFAAMALLAVGCGSAAASDATAESGDDGVATLAALDEETSTEDDSTTDAGAGAESTPEESALAFSQCMRDEGLDFPDLAVDAEGNINLREGFESVDRTDESFRDARQACQDELAAGGFGGGRRAAFDSPEIQDALVAFSDCVRDQGYDVGDLTLGGQGNGPGQGGGDGTANGNADDADGDAAEGDGDGPAGGQRQQGFGNRSARFAEQLGLDAEDPEVEAAIETCTPLLDEAFAAAGIGQANNNNG